MNQQAVKSITSALGEEICAHVGVSPDMIRHVRLTGEMPSAWFKVVSALCRENAVDCPMDAFRWKVAVEAAE